MDSTKKTLVSSIFSLSLLGLLLPACEGVDEEMTASEPAPAGAPTTETSFNVTSVVIGPDGKTRENTVRMTDSQWQEVMKRRNAAIAGEQSPAGGSAEVDRIQQGLTLSGSCYAGDSEIFYAADNFGGDRVCLEYYPGDSTAAWADYILKWPVHSYMINDRNATALICTGTYDCNMYDCGLGSSVWYNAGTCPGHINCNSQHILQPPPQTYLYPDVVHLQLYPFSCY